MATIIQTRRDTTANWTAQNPILAAGEEAYDTDLKRFKIGDGVTAYLSLPFTDEEVDSNALAYAIAFGS